MENRKSKNWWGGLWFVPALYTTARWVLSMIGDAQTAYSVFQTQWITIDWVVVSHLLAMAGVWWLICVNWDLIVKYRHKKENEKREIARRNVFMGDLLAHEAVNYMLREAKVSHALNGDKPHEHAIAILFESVAQGSIKAGIYGVTSLEQVPANYFDKAGFEWRYADTYSRKRKMLSCLQAVWKNDNKRVNAIYLNKSDVIKCFPK